MQHPAYRRRRIKLRWPVKERFTCLSPYMTMNGGGNVSGAPPPEESCFNQSTSVATPTLPGRRPQPTVGRGAARNLPSGDAPPPSRDASPLLARLSPGEPQKPCVPPSSKAAKALCPPLLGSREAWCSLQKGLVRTFVRTIFPSTICA